MSDFTNQLNSYKREITDELQKIKSEIFSHTEFDFFLKEVESHYLYDFTNCPKIIVIGSSIPEELLCGTGAYYILGGSKISSMWADDVVPRDTDPVSKSSFGYIKSGFAKKSLILIPLINDNTRKLAYILKSMGLKVHMVHFPPIKDNASLKEWKRQYEACWSAIAFHYIQGIIYHVLRGCLVYDYEYQMMEEEFSKIDIPIIRVESDYNEEDVEQLRIRIEAFVELIKLKEYAKQTKKRV